MRTPLFLVSLALVLSFSKPAGAEGVIVKYAPGEEPPHLQSRAPLSASVPAEGLFGDAVARAPAKGNRPADSWFFPWTVDDRVENGESTIISIRHQGPPETVINAEITYSDESFSFLTSRSVMLSENEVVPLNVRAVDEVIRPFGLARGIAEVEADGPISVDYFQVDFPQDFAGGSPAFVIDDFCGAWTSRFLRFPGTSGGTEFSIIINGPQGSGDMDPPTIEGEVFDQSGNLINLFSIFTDQWLYTVDALDLVLGDTAFGSIKLSINSTLPLPGIVIEEHSAFERFSISQPAICTDLPL